MKQVANDIMARMCKQLQGWLNGTTPKTDEALAEMRGGLHRDLTSVYPSGNESSDFADGLPNAHGANPAFRVAILPEKTRVIYSDVDVMVVAYLFVQAGAKAVQRHLHASRVTTVLVREGDDWQAIRMHESFITTEEETSLDFSTVS